MEEFLQLAEQPSEDPIENDGFDLSMSSDTMTINHANFTAALTSIAAKRLGDLSTEQTKDKFSYYYQTLLRDQKSIVYNELYNLKNQRELETSQSIINDAVQKGDTELVKDVSDYSYTYDPEKDLFMIEEEFANEVIESGAVDADRQIQLENETFDTSNNVSWTDVTTDILTEKALVTKYMKKYMDRLGWNTIPELILGAIPLYTMNSYSQKIKTGDKNNRFWAGNDLAEQVAKFKTMSISEKAKALKELDDFFDGQNKFKFNTFSLNKIKADSEGQANNLLAMTYFSYLMDFTTLDKNLENIIHGVDIILPVVGGVLSKGAQVLNASRKIGSSLLEGKISTAGVAAGNRASAVNQVIATNEAIRTGKQAKNTDVAAEAADLTAITSLNPLGNLGNTTGISGRLEKELQRVEKISEEIINTDQVKSLDEVKEMREFYRNHIGNEFREKGAQYADILTVKDDGIKEGLRGITYEIFYANEVGEGFASIEDAKKYAELLKLDGATVTTVQEQNTHFIKLTKPIDSMVGKEGKGGYQNFVTPYKDIDTANGMRILLASPTNYIDTSSRLAAAKVLGVKENLTFEAKKFIKIINSVSGKDKEVLGEVLEYGRNFKKWFSPSDLKYRFNLNDKQILAYQATKRMEDVNHIIINSSDYSRKQRLNYKTFKLLNKEAISKGIDENFDAIPLLDIPKPSNKTIYNVSTNKYLDNSSLEKGLTMEEQLAKFKKEGYVFASLEGSKDTEVLSPFQYIIGRSTDLKVNALTFDQVPYVAGGRVEYSGTHFVKQGRIRNSRTSIPILLRSRTHGVGSQTDAIEYTTRMEAGRKIALESLDKNGKLIASASKDSAMSKATGGLYGSVKLYTDYVDIKNLNMPFEVVVDGQELSSVVKKVLEGVNAHPNDLAEVNSIQKMINKHRFGDHKSKRGDRLFGFDGNPAPVINPFEASVNSLTRALELVTIDKWKARNVDKFFKTFGSILEDPKGKSPTNHFLTPVFRKKLSDEEEILKKQANAMRQSYTSILNTPTKVEEGIKNNFIGPIADVFNSMSSKIGLPIKYDTMQNIKDANPIQFVRGMSFNANLGMYNPKQFTIQLQATMLMMSANLNNGPRAAAIMLPMRFMLMSENPQVLGGLTRAIGKIVGFKSEEIQEIYDVIKKSGTWRLQAGSLLEQEEKMFSSASVAQKFLEFGQTPFLESERLNKIGSTIASTLDWKQANPGKKITEEAIDVIRSQSELYLANMNRVDRSSWQKGFMSVPTQFWGYQARALEMMLPEILGGSKHFTSGQKLRMIIAQIGMYGMGGLVGPKYGLRWRDSINEAYKERYGENLSEEFLDTFEGGAIESIFANAIGADISFSHRAGLGLTEGGWAQVFFHLANVDTEELQKIDAAGLSTLGGLHAGLADLIRIVNPADETFGSYEQFVALQTSAQYHFRKNISSYDAHARAYLAFQYKKTFDKQGRVTDSNTTMTEAFLGYFGLDPSNEADIRAMEQALKGEERYKKHVVSLLAKNLNMTLKINTKESWEKYLGLRKFMLGSLEEDERKNINKQVLNKATGGRPSSVQKAYYLKFDVVKSIKDGNLKD
jgi:hypothetical protein